MSFTANHPILYDPLENRIAVLNLAKNVKVRQRLKQEWTLTFDHPLDPTFKWELITTECLVEINSEKYVLKVVDQDDSSGLPIIHCEGEHVSNQTIEWFVDPADDSKYSRTSFVQGVTATTALTNALAGSRFTLGIVNVPGFITSLMGNTSQDSTTITVMDASGISVNSVIQIGYTQSVVTAKNGNILTISPGLYTAQLDQTPVGINIHDLNMQERNLTDILKDIETLWGGELSWSNRTVSFVQQIGQNNGVQMRYRKNNKQIKRTEDSRNLVTRLYGYGSGGLTIESINPTKYIDATNIANYPVPLIQSKSYSQIADPESLLQAMKTDLALLSVPKVTYDLTVIELSRLTGHYASLESFGLGDYVTVIDERLNHTSLSARINEYEYYPYEPQLSRVLVDSLIETNTDKIKQIQTGVDNVTTTVNISTKRINRQIAAVTNPVAPTATITYTQNTDGSSNVIVQWFFSEDPTSPIDGFGIVVHTDSTSTNYTFPSTITADSSRLVDKTVRGYEIHGVPIDKYYTIAVYPYRIVDPDIDPSGQIKGPLWYTYNGQPYQPSSTVPFGGTILPSGIVSDRTAYTVGTSLDGFGSGIDGVFNSTGDVTLNVPTPDSGTVIRQYESFTLNAGHTLTVSDRCRGLILVIQGDCVINGNINLSGKSGKVSKVNSVQRVLQIPIGTYTLDVPSGGTGGDGGSGGNDSAYQPNTETTAGVGGSGSNGTNGTWFGGGFGGPGGGGGGQGYAPSLPSPSFNGGNAGGNDLDSSVGIGGASGTSDNNNRSGSPGGNFCGGGGSGSSYYSSSTEYAGGGGGAGIFGGNAYTACGSTPPTNGQSGGGIGGGLLVIVCKGNLTIGSTGVINCNGLSGGNGGNGGSSTYDGGGGGGGQGGGGGGVVVLAYHGTYTNNGSLTVNGGGGGIGGAGGQNTGSANSYGGNGISGTPGSIGTILTAKV